MFSFETDFGMNQKQNTNALPQTADIRVYVASNLVFDVLPNNRILLHN